MKAKALLLVSGLISVLVPSAARAEPEPPVSAAKLMEVAATAYQAKDYPTCRTKASEAWSQVQDPRVAGLLGSCEVKLGAYGDGATHLDFYLKNAGPGGEADAADLFAQAKHRVTEVAISCRPVEADVTVDGKPMGKCQRSVFLDPGPHQIDLSANGYGTHHWAQTVTADSKLTLDTALVAMDGGSGPSSGGGAPLWPGIVALGLGAVGVGVGGALLGIAAGKDSDAKTQASGLTCSTSSLSTACKNLQSTLDSKATLGNAGIGVIATGGALLAVGLIYTPIAVLSGKRRDAKVGLLPFVVVPSFDQHSSGLLVAGKF